MHDQSKKIGSTAPVASLLTLIVLNSFSASHVFAAEVFEVPENVQVMAGYSYTAQSEYGPAQVDVQFAFPQSSKSRDNLVEYANNYIKEQQKTNSNVSIQFTYINSADTITPSVKPLNDEARREWQSGKAAVDPRLYNSRGRPSPGAVQASKTFAKIMAIPGVIATEVDVPSLVDNGPSLANLESKKTEGFFLKKDKPELTAEEKLRRTRKLESVMTLTRVTLSSGAMFLSLYYSTGPNTYLPAIAAAFIFYPSQEFWWQDNAQLYVDLTKKGRSIPERLAIRTSITVAVLTVFNYALSHAQVIDPNGKLMVFDMAEILKISFLSALYTHPWFEMVIKGRPKFLSGAGLSFSLGVAGTIGIVLESFGWPVGGFILRGLGVSGAILWTFNGAKDAIIGDATKMISHLKTKTQSVSALLTRLCVRHSRYVRGKMSRVR